MVLCPICESASAEVVPFTFAATSATVIPCEGCRSTTGISSLEIPKSGLFELELPSSVVAHRDGLVSFA